jgi:hypothetical protein
MSLLVCEGLCNPDLASVDAEVRRNTMSDGTVYLNDELRYRQRRLKHTPHRYVSMPLPYANFACEVCGHVRRCGSHV